jgi:hypothetical protein
VSVAPTLTEIGLASAVEPSSLALSVAASLPESLAASGLVGRIEQPVKSAHARAQRN